MKIVALTASIYDEERAGVIAVGCDEFVRKPVQTDTVFELLSKHIGATYIYEEADIEGVVPMSESLSLQETKAALATVPANLLSELSEAIELGDMAGIEARIGDIKQHHATLSDTLARMTQRFQFNELLLLLQVEESA
ncbi:MAG: hypothetical protein RLP44_18375 [Aggregatilineales bacterium]